MALSDTQLQQAKQVFNLYDTAGSGCISVEHVGTVLRSLGKCPSEADVRDIIRQYGLGESVNFPTFVHILESNINTFIKSEDDIATALGVFDKENTGYISAEELLHVLSVLGESMPKEEISNIIADHVQDGKIEYRSFAKALTPVAVI